MILIILIILISPSTRFDCNFHSTDLVEGGEGGQPGKPGDAPHVLLLALRVPAQPLSPTQGTTESEKRARHIQT